MLHGKFRYVIIVAELQQRFATAAEAAVMALTAADSASLVATTMRMDCERHPDFGTLLGGSMLHCLESRPEASCHHEAQPKEAVMLEAGQVDCHQKLVAMCRIWITPNCPSTESIESEALSWRRWRQSHTWINQDLHQLGLFEGWDILALARPMAAQQVLYFLLLLLSACLRAFLPGLERRCASCETGLEFISFRCCLLLLMSDWRADLRRLTRECTGEGHGCG